MLFQEIVDLGHELFDGMPNAGGIITAFFPMMTFPTTSQLSSGRVAWEDRMILMAEHCGTHLDCPYHFDQTGLSVDKVPLDRLIVPGHLLDLTHRKAREAISPADFENAAAASGRPVGPGTAVIAWTGVDREWGTGSFRTERPYVPEESALWLIERKVTLFGTDLIGVDDPDAWWMPTHTAMLKAGIPIIQQMCNLEKLAGRSFLLLAIPLKMRGGTASPIRPVALLT